jgi:hypothetical protein
MATRGDKRLERLWDWAWVHSTSFRKAIKASTFVFGLALLADAVGRVAIVYRIPVSESVALANVPGFIAFAFAVAYHLKRVKPIFRQIASEQP